MDKYKQNLKKTQLCFLLFFIVIVGIFLCSNSVYVLEETEQAVITTFGKASVNNGKGLQFKIPFFQNIKKVDTTVHGFELGYRTLDNGAIKNIEDESIMITSDYNFINVAFYVSYEITDPKKYLYNSKEPIIILKNLAQNCIRSTISSYSVDSILTTKKSEIQANIKQMMVKHLDSLDIGLKLVDITMQDAEPPTSDIMSAFKAVETAKQNKQSVINEANKYRNEQIPSAKAEADKLIQKAEAKKESRINEAKGQVTRYEHMYKEYCKNPLITKQRMFYETMEDVLPNLKVIINNGDNVQTVIPVDSFSSTFLNNNTNTSSNQSNTEKKSVNSQK